jgi:hypothetical protein
MASSSTVLPVRSSDWRRTEEAWPFAELLVTDFKVERRQQPRWQVPGTASMLALGSGLGAMLELDQLDGSPWWIGGSADEPMNPGTRVSVGFSDPSARPAQGVVMRCERKGARYRIAVKFDGAAVA